MSDDSYKKKIYTDIPTDYANQATSVYYAISKLLFQVNYILSS